MTLMIGGSYQLGAVRGGEQPQTRSTCFANDLLKQQSQVHHRDQFKRCAAPTYPTYQAQSDTKSEQSNSFTLPAVAQATGSFFTSPRRSYLVKQFLFFLSLHSGSIAANCYFSCHCSLQHYHRLKYETANINQQQQIISFLIRET